MRNTLFSKYFAICAGLIMATLVFVGGTFLVLTSNNFRAEKYEFLKRNTDIAAALTLNNYRENGQSYIERDIVTTSYSILAGACDAEFFLTDAQGKTMLCTEGYACRHRSYTIPDRILDKAVAGSFSDLGFLGGIYKGQYFTVASPVILEDGQLLGVVFASTSAKSLTLSSMHTLKLFLLASVTVMAVSFVVLYFVTRRMTRPLTTMAAVAQSFGKGDFSQRVKVDRLDEIGQLSLAFNNMADSLSVMESMRRSFIANVSHELKTPMTTIGGFIDGILDGTIPPEKQESYLRIVSSEVKRLSRLVRAMLGIAKIESGEVELNPTSIDIHDVICSIIFTFEQRIEEKNLDIRGLDCDKVYIEGDQDLIYQAMYNLVENAVKFTDQGGYLEFSFQTSGNSVCIGVRNSGKGISKEELPRIFDRFYKSDTSRSLDKTGVGLGLHIVRSVINLHGGEIVVRSVENEYCEFLVTLRQPKNSQTRLKKSSNMQ